MHIPNTHAQLYLLMLSRFDKVEAADLTKLIRQSVHTYVHFICDRYRQRGVEFSRSGIMERREYVLTLLILASYGFFKELRPSEPYLTEYLVTNTLKTLLILFRYLRYI
jgi:hypothetical protein